MAPSRGAPETPDRRFPKSERLLRNADYQRVYRAGRSFPGTYLVVFLKQDAECPRRIGIVAGKRVGGAVRRNRAKRRLREAYRLNKHRVPGSGVELVLVARRACADAGYAEVRDDLIRVLKRALPGPDTSGPETSNPCSSV